MKVNIAYAPDNNFTNLAIVSMVSVLENNKNNEVEFIILYSNLNDSSISAFDFLKNYDNCKLRFVKVDEEIFKDFPLACWVTVQTWFRTVLGDLCPDLDRILYLDCDNLIAGVTDIVGEESHVKRLEIDDNTYFNAGVLLFNAKLIREENTFAKIKEYAVGKKLQCADQDAINKVADNQKFLLDPKYNYLETWESNYENDYNEKYSKLYAQAKDNPVIIHFVGMKPFFYKNLHSCKFQWWKYAQKSNLTVFKERFLEEEKQFDYDIKHFSYLKFFIDFILSKVIFEKKLRNKFKAKVKSAKDVLNSAKFIEYNAKIKQLF